MYKRRLKELSRYSNFRLKRLVVRLESDIQDLKQKIKVLEKKE